MGQAQDKPVDEDSLSSPELNPVRQTADKAGLSDSVKFKTQGRNDLSVPPPFISQEEIMFIRHDEDKSQSTDEDTDEQSTEGKSFTSDGKGLLKLKNIGDSFSLSSTSVSSPKINFSQNTLAGLTIRESPFPDSKAAGSIVQAATIKSIKEQQRVSKKSEDNNQNDENDENDESTIIALPLSSTTESKSTRETLSEEKMNTSTVCGKPVMDEKPYTIPPAIAENVLREMLANKPDPVVLERLKQTPTPISEKSDSPSGKSKLKGNTTSHKKNGESSEESKNGGKKNNLLISSGASESPHPSKFTFPNIADKNFFVTNFTTTNPINNSSAAATTTTVTTISTTISPPSVNPFSFGSLPESSSTTRNPFQHSGTGGTPSIQNQPQEQRRIGSTTTPWNPPVIEKFSPDFMTKSPGIQMPMSSSFWPPTISTTSPTDTQFSNSGVLFPQFSNSFNFDINSKKGVTSDSQSSNMANSISNSLIPTMTGLGSSSTSRAGTNSANGTASQFGLASTSEKGGASSNPTAPSFGQLSTPTVKKLPIKFGDFTLTQVTGQSGQSSSKGATSVGESTVESPINVEAWPSTKGLPVNGGTNNFPSYRPIRPLPARAKARLSAGGGPSIKERSLVEIPKNNTLFPSKPGSDSTIAGSSTQPSLPMIPPSPLFSFSTPAHSDGGDDDFDQDEDDANNDGNHTDWLDNANNKKKRKALQTVGGSSIVTGSGSGIIKTSTSKERASPLRRVERRSSQRVSSSLNKAFAGSESAANKKTASNNEMNSLQTPNGKDKFEFSFKSVAEKSAAATAASVNAASAKRLAAVSPLNPMNTKNDPFSSSMYLNNSTVSNVGIQTGTKKKVSSKRAAPSSALFKTDGTAVNPNLHTSNIGPSTAKSHVPPVPPPVAPKRPPNAGRKKNKKKVVAGSSSNQQNQHHDDTSSTGSFDVQSNVNTTIPASRRKVRFHEKNGDWICLFCEYKLYYGDGRRTKRKPKTNSNINSGEGSNSNDNPHNGGQGKSGADKALAS